LVRSYNYRFSAAATFIEMVVFYCVVPIRKINDSLRMCMSKSVDRLINVSNDGEGTIPSQDIQQLLLGSIQILILIHDDIVIAV
jgi:hypothetical protein